MTNVVAFPELAGRQLTAGEQFWSNIKYWWIRNVWRRLPRLVWYGQEVDVTISFDIPPMKGGADPIFDAHKALIDAGVSFDSGGGFGQADWEFDWSLKGPAHVKFRGRAREPQRRGLGDPVANSPSIGEAQ